MTTLRTDRVVVRSTDRAVTVVARGRWDDVASLDLGLQTPGDTTCADLRSRTPRRTGAQAVVLYVGGCGDLVRTSCPGAAITRGPAGAVLRFRVPQSCLGSPEVLSGDLTVQDTDGRVDGPQWGAVRRG